MAGSLRADESKEMKFPHIDETNGNTVTDPEQNDETYGNMAKDPEQINSFLQSCNASYFLSMKEHRKEFRELKNILHSEFRLILLPSLSVSVSDRLHVLCEALEHLQNDINATTAVFTSALQHISAHERQSVIDALLKQPVYSCYGLTNLLVKVKCAKIDLAMVLDPHNKAVEPTQTNYLCTVCERLLQKPVVLTCSHCVCWDCHDEPNCKRCHKPQNAKKNEHVHCVLENFIYHHFERFSKSPPCAPSAVVHSEKLSSFDVEFCTPPGPKHRAIKCDFGKGEKANRERSGSDISTGTGKSSKNGRGRSRNHRRSRRAGSCSPQLAASPELRCSTPPCALMLDELNADTHNQADNNQAERSSDVSSSTQCHSSSRTSRSKSLCGLSLGGGSSSTYRRPGQTISTSTSSLTSTSTSSLCGSVPLGNIRRNSSSTSISSMGSHADDDSLGPCDDLTLSPHAPCLSGLDENEVVVEGGEMLWFLEEEDSSPAAVVRTGLLRSLRQLLQHARPGSFLALDIDDTLCVNKYHPCQLMSEGGVQEFQRQLSKNPKYRRQSFLETKELTKRLQHKLRENKLLESDAAVVLRDLREKGCWIFGLTSRYSEMASSTNKMLLELGLDLSTTSPFSKARGTLRDPLTGAVCSDGVIYSNALDKGMILNRFLENVLFRSHIEARRVRSAFSPCPAPGKLPPQIIFVDDRIKNVECVAKGLDVCAPSNLNIDVSSLYFSPSPMLPSEDEWCPPVQTNSLFMPQIEWMELAQLTEVADHNTNRTNYHDKNADDSSLQLVTAQIDHFVRTGDVINDYDAKQISS